jgi:hypothetical protein
MLTDTVVSPGTVDITFSPANHTNGTPIPLTAGSGQSAGKTESIPTDGSMPVPAKVCQQIRPRDTRPTLAHVPPSCELCNRPVP